jgi:Fe-coproporphyrin III synthase
MNLWSGPLGYDNLAIWSRWLAKALRSDAYRLFRHPYVLPRVFPAQMLLAVTYQCNARCRMCSIWQEYPRAPERQHEEMTYAEFRAFLEGNGHLITVGTTGGETYLRDDVTDMWLLMDRHGYRTGTSTNAIALEETIEKESFLLGRLSGRHLRQLSISIDGLPEVHDRGRGTAESFERAWKLFNWALEQEKIYPFFQVEIACTLTEDNYREFPAFLERLTDSGVADGRLGVIVAMSSSVYYKNDSTAKTIQDRQRLAGYIELATETYPGFEKGLQTKGQLMWLRDPDRDTLPCLAGSSFGFVDPYWNVYPCPFLTYSLGNLRDSGFALEKIWNEDQIRAFRMRMRRESCNLCWSDCSRWISMRSTTRGLVRLAIDRGRNRLLRRLR